MQRAHRLQARQHPRRRAYEHPVPDQVRQAIVGAHPDAVAIGIRHQRPDGGIGQAFLGAVAARPAVPEPAQAVRHAAQPEVSLAVLEGVEQVEEAVGTRPGDGLDAAVGTDPHQAEVATGPEVAVAVGIDEMQRQGAFAGCARDRAPARGAVRIEPAGRGRPHLAIDLEQVAHDGRAAIGPERCSPGLSIPPVYAVDTPHPQDAARPHHGVRDAKAGQRTQDTPGHARHAGRRGGPDLSVRLQVQAVDPGRIAFAAPCDRVEAALAPYRHAAARADPQGPRGVHHQCGRHRVRQRGIGVGRMRGEAHAVEAGHAGLGRDPDIAIAILRDRHRTDLGHAFLYRPAVAHVMVERLRRIQCPRRLRQQGAQQQGEQGAQGMQRALPVPRPAPSPGLCRHGAPAPWRGEVARSG